MEQRPTPAFFYGSAIAALIGLLCGLILHAGWENHPGGPQLLFSSAAAGTLHNPSTDDQAAADPSPIDMAELDTDYVPPEPLPVTRLDPGRFEFQRAAAEAEQREDIDDLVADAAPQAPRRESD